MSAHGQAMPVLLLKTKSGPTDAYEELFSAPPRAGYAFAPAFVPVLQHQFEEAGLARVRDALRRRRIGRGPDADFGGLVFTSQRAVEAFAKLVAEGPPGGEGKEGGEEEKEGEGGHGEKTTAAAAAAASAWPHLQDVPVYSVGPATTRALRAVPQTPPLQVWGEHTGNGDALARFVLDHYGAWYGDATEPKPPLLFLVGEQRRDVIPRTLMDPALPAARRIPVVEVVVYGTGVMASFPRDFAAELRRTAGPAPRWVVVFSPTGCDSMLRGLGRLGPRPGPADGEADGEADAAASSSSSSSSSSPPDPGREGGDEGARGPTYIATIGPTTRDYLRRTFGYEPDVCAETPSPEGVWEGITRFMASAKAS